MIKHIWIIAALLSTSSIALSAQNFWGGPRIHDFGAVIVGDTEIDTLTYDNLNDVAQVVGSFTVSESAARLGFGVVGTIPAAGYSVPRRGRLLVIVRFTPRSTSSVRDTIELQSMTPRPFGVRLSGSGIDPIDTLGISLRAAVGRVGQPLALRVEVAPGLDAWRPASPATLVLAMSPRSFEALESPGWRVEDHERGRVVFSRTDTSAITGGLLAVIMLRPLSSARPIDTVALLSARLEGIEAVISSSPATVALEGCDIGRDVGLARRMEVASATVTRDVVTIEYRAPAGVVPRLRVFDRAGSVVLERALAAGTDAPQIYSLPMASLAPGLLIVELVVEQQRVCIPILNPH